MTVLYFSSTGNCLYVAKRLGGRLLSIPNCMEENLYEIEDTEVGIVFPVYGLCVPPFIAEFIGKLNVTCDYFFAVATYGFFPGAVCGQLRELSSANGRRFDYINRLKMAENCITFADMAKQQGDSDKQQHALAAIISDIGAKRAYVRPDSPLKRVTTKGHLKNYEFPTGVGITGELIVSDACVGCGICEKVCPMQNIHLTDGRPVFGKNCVSCGACLQNCPKTAIHHKREKSAARYRNPHVKLEELFSHPTR